MVKISRQQQNKHQYNRSSFTYTEYIIFSSAQVLIAIEALGKRVLRSKLNDCKIRPSSSVGHVDRLLPLQNITVCESVAIMYLYIEEIFFVMMILAI